jgi:two-component system sensor histidine kinase AlgZ
MSPNGATSTAAVNTIARPKARPADSHFLPNFCDARMALAVVLISELLALTFSLVGSGEFPFLTELARISIFLQWLGLTSAGLLCGLRRLLSRQSTAVGASLALAIVLANVLLLSIATVLIGRWIGLRLGFDGTLEIFPAAIWPFAWRNLVIGLVVMALLLRYFYMSQQWRRHVESEARSRIDALQARIRPHFLFNSMNTIASLTRTDPGRAEEAIEDLADLFRATLGDSARLLSLKEELELSRIYQRIEMLRLGDRLRVDWQVAELPMRAQLPGLTIQPLLENAIYHGIEPLDDGGTVTIRGTRHGDEVEISVSNPTRPSPAAASARQGNRIAIDNIRERLKLAFDGRGRLEVAQSDDRYEVRVRFPVIE